MGIDPKWLEWAKRLQAASQNGLAYATNPFDVERYQAIRSVASEIMATHTAAEPTLLEELFAGETGHATPKVDVRGAVFREGAILLVREREDGQWSLPGGWADVYDTPSEAVVREVVEESGYQTRPIKLIALYDRTKQGHTPMPFHAYKVFFLLELLGGTPAGSIETDDVAFFREDQLPELSLRRVTPAQLERCFAHYRQPELPTDFD